MKRTHLFLTFILLSLFTAVGFADDKQKSSPSEKTDRAALENALSKKLTNATLVGTFTVDGNSDKPPQPERYVLGEVKKLKDDTWMFQYGKTDIKIPIPLKILWAGDTPMISMTDFTIPGMGTFTVRLFFYGDRYAGTWQHGKVGGHMFGKIEPPKKKEEIEKLLETQNIKNEADASELERRSHHHLYLLGLAFHKYHKAHNSFPAHASFDADGKPLLSWRVHLLPSLGQEKLYRQFRLSEPWDSAHNRRLVAPMPKVYEVPLRKPLAKGKTCYLVPIGITLFRGKQPPRINEVRDGISYTILLVEADRKHAVIWTKPDDINIDANQPRKGLTGHRRGGFLALFVEGTSALIPERLKYKSSGRQLNESKNAEALRNFFQPDDGRGFDVELNRRAERDREAESPSSKR